MATDIAPDALSLRTGRRQRALEQMAVHDLDILVLGRQANIRYVTGAPQLWIAGTRPFGPVCVLVRATGDIYLNSTDDEGVPEEIGHDHLYGLAWNPLTLIEVLKNIDGAAAARRVGTDAITPTFAALLPDAFPRAELVDAEPALRAARRVKTPAETEAMGLALRVAERGLAAGVAELRPGVAERTLAAVVLEAMAAGGVSTPATQDAAWMTSREQPGRRAHDRSRVHSGDLVAFAAGALANGYVAEVGRTWPAGGTADESVHDLFRRSTALFANMVAACRPGAATAELLGADRTFSWTVRGMLVAPTHGMIGGPRKSLKSYVGTFIDLGIATGTPIFGRFGVDRPGPVLAYVGEGGRVPYTRRLERVAAAMGTSLAEVPLHVSFDIAEIGSPRFTESLQRDLGELEPALVHVDPLYAFHPAGVSASNLFEEGAMLAGLSGQCGAAGASLLVASHFNKTGSGAGLDRITHAGGQEWSDTWILLSHRQDPDVPNGRFYLTLEIGSRQWGGSAWDLNLDLGRFDEALGEYDGAITWDLNRAGSAPSAASSRLVELVAAQPWQLSREALARALGGNLAGARRAVDEALRRGELATTEVIAIRSNGRPDRRTVYGPSTNVRPAGTQVDAGSDEGLFSQLSDRGTYVRGSDDG
jgi:Xaa-Pro aminopeptidase